MSRSHSFLAFVAVALSGCGAHESLETSSSVKAVGPNLRFVGSSVELTSVPGKPTVAPGGKVEVPCSTTGIRIKYKYANGGNLAAAAHKNSGQALGSAQYSFSMAALGSGVAREAHVSLGAIVNPNVETPFRITLDHTGGLIELSETDNAFKANIVRVCP